MYAFLWILLVIFFSFLNDVDFSMGLTPVFIYIITLNEGTAIQITHMFVHELGGPISFIFFPSTAWFLIASFDQTLSSTAGWCKFIWWVLRSRNGVLREQDMRAAELGHLPLLFFLLTRSLSWGDFSTWLFCLTWNTEPLLVNCLHNLREKPHTKTASCGWRCSTNLGLPQSKDSLALSICSVKRDFKCCCFYLPSPLALAPLD